MAYEENGQLLGTFVSSADLSADANQFRLVKFHTVAGQIALAADGADKIIGILQNKPNTGEVALVRDIHAGGIAKVRMAITQNISIGDDITSDSSGDGAETTTADDQSIGVAIEADAVTVDGQIMSVYLSPSIVGGHS